jgi:hypothetical protein
LYTQEADGVAGLGYGSTALPAQLARVRAGSGGGSGGAGAPGAFTLCLGRSGGAMAIGRAPAAGTRGPLQYVPLLPSSRGYYTVSLDAWKVAGTPLDVDKVRRRRARARARAAGLRMGPPERGRGAQRRRPRRLPLPLFPPLQAAFGPLPSKSSKDSPPKAPPGGVIIDSGATFSYVATPAFQALIKALSGHMRALESTTSPPRGGERVTSDASGGGGGGGGGSSGGGSSGGRRRALLDSSGRPPRGRVLATPAPDPTGADAACWKVSGEGAEGVENEYDLEGIFPDLELVFSGGAALRLPPARYAFVAAKRRDRGKREVIACLGVFDGDDETVIGA